MAGKDMKFTAILNDQVSKGIVQISAKIGELTEKLKKEGQKQADGAKDAADKMAATARRRESDELKAYDSLRSQREKAYQDLYSLQRASVAREDSLEKQRQSDRAQLERQRIALQRNSLAMAEAQQAREAQTNLQANKYLADSSLRISRQAAQAEAALVLDRFERRIAVERVKHAQILMDLKGNDAAQEAEVRRHNAVVSRIQMDQANFPNTPFQQMLGSFGKLNQGLARALPMMTTAAGQVGAMSSTFGAASGAVGAFGGVLSSFAMGPAGIAIAAVTVLSAGIDKIIESTDRAATLKADFGKNIQDPTQLKAIVSAMEKFEAARGKRGGGATAASKEVRALTGESAEDMQARGLSAASLKAQQVALEKRTKGHEKFTDDYLAKEQELASAVNATIQDETKRAIADENTRFQYQVRALKEGSLTRATEIKLHEQNIRNIQTKAARDAADERDHFNAMAEANAAKREEKYQKDLTDRRKKVNEDGLKMLADEARTKEYYDKQEQENAKRIADANKFERDSKVGAMAPGMDQQRAELAARQQDEIAAFNLSEEAKTMGLMRAEIVRYEIRQRYANEAKRLEEANAIAVASAMRGNLEGVAQQLHAFAPIYKTFAQFENAIATRAAAIEAYKAGSAIPVIGVVAGPAAAAAAIGFGISNAAKINSQKFARGTDYAPGGMALVGEQGPEMVYLPRGSQVKTAGETSRMMGSAGHTFNVTVNAPGASASDAGHIADTVDARLWNLANDLDEIDYRNIRRSGRA